MKRELKKMARLCLWILALTALIGLFPLRQTAFAADPITLEQSEYSIEIGSLKSIYVDNGQADKSTWVSSNENVVTITYQGFYSATVNAVGVGESTISVSDDAGNTASAKITVTAPDLILDQTEGSVSISDGSWCLEIESGYDVSFTSSEPSVAIIEDYSDFYCNVKLLRPGTTIITATDCAGVTVDVPLTVTDAEWSVETTTFIDTLDNEYDYIYIDTFDNDLEFTITNSNKNVVKAELNSGFIELEYVSIGNATVTIKDQYGKTVVINITIKPPLFSFEKNTKTKYTAYEGYDGYSDIYLYLQDYEGEIVSASSSNTKVAKVMLDTDEKYCVEVVPVGVGSTTITAKDKYGQTCSITITLTQKYFDEFRYLEDLEAADVWNDDDYNYSKIIYGYKNIYCSCEISASVYTTINDKKYTATVDEYGDYVFRNLPKLNAGKSITIYLKKGEAIAKKTIKISQRSGKEASISIKAQTYSGKALTPPLTVKCNGATLKKGVDYKVKYSNNTKVGTATATVTFIGNYKGAKSKTFKINKAANSLTVKAKTATVKRSAVKKKTQILEITKVITFTKKGQGKLSYAKVSGNKKITINKTTGKVTVKKGLKKGTYKVKVKVKAAGNTNYKASAWKTVTFTVKVK